MPGKNDITGDPIVNNKGDTNKYSDGWDAIWGNNNNKNGNAQDINPPIKDGTTDDTHDTKSD